MCAQTFNHRMRKAYRNGMKFCAVPGEPERRESDEFRQAEEQWRLFVKEMDADLYSH